MPSQPLAAEVYDSLLATPSEHDSLVQAITKVAQQLAVLRQRALMLSAHVVAHRQSIDAWDAAVGEPQDSTPSAL